MNHPYRVLRVLGFLFTILLAVTLDAASAVRASHGTLTLPTYPWTAVKHPYFRGTDGVNIYPYPMLDFLSREKTNRTYQTVVLENDYLRVTFLPELGGKIHEVIDKTTGQPMFYVNHVIKPALIGLAGAWTSGGVEWNTGPQGHTVGCMQPATVLILPAAPDGSRSVAIGETERIYRTRWTVVVTLRPDRSFLEETIRIYNPTETIRPYYFWNCTAVPNTPGFRFIYPMKLGTDHGAEKFFQWPVHEGKDLTKGTNYQDASSIFAWHCDQNFFGSYNDDLQRGVVAFANHHQLPGKKAWTWGQGGFGRMHQMDLTDADGPYNEVQTGPLLTQGEVGRLEPCEAVEWKEWWYPIHAIGGFTYANRDVAVNAERTADRVQFRILPTGDFRDVSLRLRTPGEGREGWVAAARLRLTPREATTLSVTLPPQWVGDERRPWELRSGTRLLAEFSLPLDLPQRVPPEKKPKPETASQKAQAGWEAFLFAKFEEAEKHARQALELDPRNPAAHLLLSFLHLDADPAAAEREAAAALEVAPETGLAHYARAVAAERAGDQTKALDEAWMSALDPATAVAARALVAKLQLRRGAFREVEAVLTEPGPWQNDLQCRARLAYAYCRLGQTRKAVAVVQANLAVDPLDTVARSVWWASGERGGKDALWPLLDEQGYVLGEVAAQWSDWVGDDRASVQRLVRSHVTPGAKTVSPLMSLWLPPDARLESEEAAARRVQTRAPTASAGADFFYQREVAPLLSSAVAAAPSDGAQALRLGHLLFHLGRTAEARVHWENAARAGAEPVVAYRALGMASLRLDQDPQAARKYLTLANQADPGDAIVARDLARVLFQTVEKEESADRKRELLTQVRDTLQAAFQQGQGRSDFVALLARSMSRLDQYEEVARLLDAVRITIWEGAQEAHELFEQTHLVLGQRHLTAGRGAEALREFDRALAYPENLATGRLENAREADIQYWRGRALWELGRRDEAKQAWRRAAAEPASEVKAKEEARQKAREALDREGK